MHHSHEALDRPGGVARVAGGLLLFLGERLALLVVGALLGLDGFLRLDVGRLRARLEHTDFRAGKQHTRMHKRGGVCRVQNSRLQLFDEQSRDLDGRARGTHHWAAAAAALRAAIG